MHRFLTSLLAGVLLSLFMATPAAAQAWRPEEPRATAPKDADQPPAGQPGSGLATYKPEVEEGEYLRLREEHIARLRGYEPGKPFDPSARVRALQQLEAQEAARTRYAILFNTVIPLAYPNWVELGPNPIPNGQTSPSNPVSGRVTAIEVDPADANKVYVGTAQGGVFRSLNGGATWTPIFDSAQSLAIGALALDAPNGRLYVGTGESSGSGDSFGGVGLYRIDAVNTTATLVGPINPARHYNDDFGDPVDIPVFTGRSISKILIVPNNPSVLFVATGSGVMGIAGEPAFGGFIPPLGLRGLYRLSGVTGTPASVTVTRLVVSPTSPGGCFDTPCTGNRNINDMVFDPGDLTGNTLLVWQNGINVAGDGGVWRSTNAMAATPAFTQTFITTGTSTSRGSGRFAIYKQGASPAVVYIATGEPSIDTSCLDSSEYGALRVSTDGGLTFGAKLLGGGGFCGGQCIYNMGFAALPGASTARTDDRLYLAGQYAGHDNCSLGAGRSADGGATFTEVDGTHADAHCIRVAPSNSNIIYRGDDGGIWKSTDAGTSWTSLNNSTFRATQFHSVAVHPTDPNFSIGGTQDNGTSHLLPSGLWNRVDYGDGGYALIDQSATNTADVVMYHTYFNRKFSLVGFARADSVTTAFAGNWLFFGCEGFDSNGITCGDTVLFYAPMTLGPGTPNTVYYGSDRLYRSVDKGVTNTVVSQAPLVAGAPISSIAVSRLDDNYRIVGLAQGSLFYTTTGSATMTDLDPTGIIPNQFVARIAFDPVNKNTAYIALGGYMESTLSAWSHVWKVTNLDTTPVLTAINGAGVTGLPDVPVNGLAVDPLKTSRLFVGTDIGVYFSEDTGATWNPLGTGLPRVAVFDMAVQNVKRVLRIATHGRGMWEIPLPPIAGGDSTAPAGAIVVNADASYTKLASVSLRLTATDAVGVTGYYVANTSATPAAGQAGWTAVTPTTSLDQPLPTWALVAGDGAKTVYAWYKDAAGNVSTTKTDAIILDQTAPVNGTLTATAGNQQVTLNWSGQSDATSGVAGYKLVFATGTTPPANCTGTVIATTSPYTHTGRTNGQPYAYRLCTTDNATNVSAGATATATPTGAPTGARVRGDFNADGKADIFWRNTSTGETSLWTMNGATFSAAVRATTIATSFLPAVMGDFDGDARTDIYWRNASTGQSEVWLGWNGTAFATRVAGLTVATAWVPSGAGDLNGDGKADIFWRNTSTGQTSVWFMNGARYASTAVTSAVPMPWTPAAFGDFDADGKMDVLWRQPSTGETSVWLGWNGTTFATQVRTATSVTAWIPVGGGDINGDGRADVFWRNNATGETRIWFMNGAAFTNVASTRVPLAWLPTPIADFSGDTRSDIYWRNATTGETSVWLGWNGAAFATQVAGRLVTPTTWTPVGAP